MSNEESQRILWRHRWLDSINELTSLELQTKSWQDRTNSNPHWSFVEFMCCYFDDLSIDNNYEHQLKNKLISINEFEIIEPWHKLLDDYNSPNNDDYDVESILNDNKWRQILDKGQFVKGQLSKVLNNEEVEILNRNIDYLKVK